MTVPLFTEKFYIVKCRLFQQNLTFNHLNSKKEIKEDHSKRSEVDNSICMENAHLLINRPKIRHQFARQDVEFYNQGKVQLGKTNITRDIALQPDFCFAFLTQALNCLRHRFAVGPHCLFMFELYATHLNTSH